MSDRKAGLQASLAHARERIRQLVQENQVLYTVLKASDMEGVAEVILNSKKYSGGLFDRLGHTSQLLSAIAWDNYPDKSFEGFVNSVRRFSPELANILNEYGINFAVLAPGERLPATSQSWQLETFGDVEEFQEFENEKNHFRVYLLEMFFDAVQGGVSPELISKLYQENKVKLEASSDKFATALLKEVQDSLFNDYRFFLSQLHECSKRLEGIQNV